jgi:hypothetical protein
MLSAYALGHARQSFSGFSQAAAATVAVPGVCSSCLTAGLAGGSFERASDGIASVGATAIGFLPVFGELAPRFGGSGSRWSRAESRTIS